MPDEVQRAVDDGLAQVLGVLGADHDVAQLARAGARSPSLVDREREHVGRPVLAAVLAVELAIRSASTNSTATWPVLDARPRRARARQPLDLERGGARGAAVADDLDLEQRQAASARCGGGRSSGALRSECSS